MLEIFWYFRSDVAAISFSIVNLDFCAEFINENVCMYRIN